ncbi:MAG TPA: hypothetical protein VF606_11160, partial [Geminicoccaceae bacterium]
MNRLIPIAAGLAALSAATAANAQPADWTGGYVGVQLGYNLQPRDRNETILFDTDLNGSFGENVNTAVGANAFSPGFCGGSASGTGPSAGCRGDRDRPFGAVHAG